MRRTTIYMYAYDEDIKDRKNTIFQGPRMAFRIAGPLRSDPFPLLAPLQVLVCILVRIV